MLAVFGEKCFSLLSIDSEHIALSILKCLLLNFTPTTSKYQLPDRAVKNGAGEEDDRARARAAVSETPG